MSTLPHLTLAILASLFLLLPAKAQGLLPPKTPQPVEIKNVEDVLKWIPKELLPKKGRPLTQPQMDAVNQIFKAKLQKETVVLNIREKITDIPIWEGITKIYSDVPNKEGYFIRVFAAFTPNWHPKLATLNLGDKVTITGPVTHIAYLNLWNQFTLSISSDNSSFAK